MLSNRYLLIDHYYEIIIVIKNKFILNGVIFLIDKIFKIIIMLKLNSLIYFKDIYVI